MSRIDSLNDVARAGSGVTWRWIKRRYVRFVDGGGKNGMRESCFGRKGKSVRTGSVCYYDGSFGGNTTRISR